MKTSNFLKWSTYSLLLFAFYSTAIAANTDFSDVPPTHPNYAAIQELKSRGIISGYPDNSFKPDQFVNRAEALKIILIGSLVDAPGANGNAGFTDVQSDSWYSNFIVRAIAMGVIQGYPDQTFKPNKSITLVETLKILLLTNSIDLSEIKILPNLFPDALPDQCYSKYLQFAKNVKLIVGDSLNRVQPMQEMTRGKFAEIVYRFINLYPDLLPIQKQRANQLISLFENGTTEIQYNFAKNLNDGRGITSGRAGFTTATGDSLEVIKRYTSQKPSNLLSKYLPELEKLSADRSDNTSGLVGFEDNWAESATDQIFRSVQDSVVDDFYFLPAMRLADEIGLNLGLSRAVIYDTIIQHGDGEDPDGLPALIQQTNDDLGGSPLSGINEETWLTQFLQVRRADLANAHDALTRKAWAKSVSRCDVFMQLVSNKNYDLKGPIDINTDIYQTTIQ